MNIFEEYDKFEDQQEKLAERIGEEFPSLIVDCCGSVTVNGTIEQLKEVQKKYGGEINVANCVLLI